MTPCIVLDTETTGFPNQQGGFGGRIVEVGAVVVTHDARIVSPISFLVRQPERHLRSWQAQKAMSVHGIGVDQILQDGIDPAQAAPRLARWVGRVRDRFDVAELRAYNQPFDFWFLERAPWRIFERTGLCAGEDIRDTAGRAMGQGSRPSLAKAIEHARSLGAQLSWESDAHRALEDARMAAMVAISLGDQTAQRVA